MTRSSGRRGVRLWVDRAHRRHRRGRAWWLRRFRSATSPIDRAMRWLTNLDWEGEPAVIDPIAQRCADGIIVRPGVGDGDWFFIDGAGSVYLLPGWCDGPRWVEARLARGHQPGRSDRAVLMSGRRAAMSPPAGQSGQRPERLTNRPSAGGAEHGDGP